MDDDLAMNTAIPDPGEVPDRPDDLSAGRQQTRLLIYLTREQAAAQGVAHKQVVLVRNGKLQIPLVTKHNHFVVPDGWQLAVVEVRNLTRRVERPQPPRPEKVIGRYARGSGF